MTDQPLFKLGRVRDSRDEPFHYPDLWQHEKTSGPERLVLAPSRGHIGLLLDLTVCLKAPFWMLYVLLDPRRDHAAGRYETPDPLDGAELRAFLGEFKDYLETDARHHLWIGSTTGNGLLVYDQHNLIYAYGPLEGYEEIVHRSGLREGTVTIPAPHSHHFHPAFDDDEDALLSRWNWTRSPLRDGDQA